MRLGLLHCLLAAGAFAAVSDGAIERDTGGAGADTALFTSLIRDPSRLPWEQGDSPLEAVKALTSMGFRGFESQPGGMIEQLRAGTFRAPEFTAGGSLSCQHVGGGELVLRYRWTNSAARMRLQDVVLKLPAFVGWQRLYDRAASLGYARSPEAGSSFLRKTVCDSASGMATVYVVQVRAYDNVPELVIAVVYRGRQRGR